MNNNIKIELNLKQTISVVSGRPGGINCYKNQMKDIVEKNLNMENSKIIIVFPSHIKLVSGSYLLGMFEEISNIIGVEGIKRKFEFESNTGDNLLQILLDELKRSAY